MIETDLLCPIAPKLTTVSSYVMVMTDYSKWLEAVALPHTTAITSSDCLYKHIVLKHGQMSTVISNRGTNLRPIYFTNFVKH